MALFIHGPHPKREYWAVKAKGTTPLCDFVSEIALAELDIDLEIRMLLLDLRQNAFHDRIDLCFRCRDPRCHAAGTAEAKTNIKGDPPGPRTTHQLHLPRTKGEGSEVCSLPPGGR